MTKERIWKWGTKKDYLQAIEYEEAIKEEIIDKIRLHLKFADKITISSITNIINKKEDNDGTTEKPTSTILD